MSDVIINANNLDKIKTKIPIEDFINSKYDYLEKSKLTDVLIIFSTPRSGSTFLCDLIYKNSICIPHEYFQHYEYLPLLAERWGSIKNSVLNKHKFIDSLIESRTASSGWLGINLHGGHLQTFSKFEDLFPKVNFHYVHVIREDTLSQAVSYEIARQTGKWSSNFKSHTDANYRFTEIKNKLESIHQQNVLIESYIKLKQIHCSTVYYEELVNDPQAIMKDLLPAQISNNLVRQSSLKKQSTNINEEWIAKFSKEFFETNGSGYNNNQKNTKNIKRYFQILFGK